MVLNVSGRTDIVAFYMDWFMNRLKDGYVLSRNPFCKSVVHRIDFKDVDAIVFCTKNPAPLLKFAKEIEIPYVVHVTLTAYEKDIEPYVPNKTYTIDVVKKLSRIIGKDRIFIRYDPILLNEKYDVDFHIKAFDRIVSSLEGCTSSIIVSFVDEYKNVLKNMECLKIKKITDEDLEQIGINFSKIASEHGMTVETCGEEDTLFQYGFIQRDCVTSDLIYKISGVEIKNKWNARNNKNCNCIKMYDIGAYNTCKHYCKYCYANYSEEEIENNYLKHYDDSPLLIGSVQKDDIIKNVAK